MALLYAMNLSGKAVNLTFLLDFSSVTPQLLFFLTCNMQSLTAAAAATVVVR